MKKLLTAKSLSFLMLLSLLGGKAEAARQRDDGYVAQGASCCRSSCYECGCNPLYCGAWDVQIQAGVDPILWRNRQPLYGVTCTAATSLTPVYTLFAQMPKFNQFFKIPWTVGGQFGYHMSDNSRVYVEFDYVQANAKTAPQLVSAGVIGTGPVTTTYTTTFQFNKYKLFEAYVGARHYFDRWCDRVSFFLGAKVGLTHHKALTTSLSFVVPVPATPPVAVSTVYASNTVVSGGANVGFDCCFCGNWSFVVTGEIVASAGPTAQNLLLPAALGAGTGLVGTTNFFFGAVSELRFPVTAAIRYSF